MSGQDRRYWVVSCQHEREPANRFDSEELADAHAEYLRNSYPGLTFYVEQRRVDELRAEQEQS